MNRRTGLAPALILLAPALIFFAPALLFNRAVYLRDTGLYFFPHKRMVAEALRAGRLPQWNPQEYGGLPFLADPNFNVFHPLSLLTDLLPLPLGFTLLLLSCALLAASGTLVLARRLGTSQEGAVVAALAFAWSGPFLSVLEGGQVVAAAFMPWVCAAALRPRGAATAVGVAPAVAGTGWRRPWLAGVVPVAAASALLFLSGTPELGGCALLFGLLLAERRGSFLIGVALGAGIAAVQLLPTALFLGESSRAGGFSLAEAASSALPLRRLPELLLPGSGDLRPYLENIHLGVLPVALAAFGYRKRPLLWLAALALLLLAVGPATPLYALALKALPPVRIVRYPEKLLVPVALVVAIHAGAGWDALARFRWMKLPRVRHALAALLVLELAWPAALLDRTVPAAELTAKAPLVAEIERDARAPPWSYRVDVQGLGLSAEDLLRVGEPGWPLQRKVFWVRRQALYDGGAAAAGLHLGRGYSGFTPGEMRELYRQGPGALDRLAVRYGVEFGTPSRASPYAALGFEPMGARADGLVRLWRNPRALPRLRLVGAALPGRAGSPPPPCQAVWLPPADLALARAVLVPDCSRAVPAAGSAEVVSFEPERVEARVEAAAPALAVLADTLAGGWTATLDGASAPLLHADGALRAVLVPPGLHAVVFSYRAPGLEPGAWITLASLTFILGGSAQASRKQKLTKRG